MRIAIAAPRAPWDHRAHRRAASGTCSWLHVRDVRESAFFFSLRAGST